MGIVHTLQRVPSEYAGAIVVVLGAWIFLRLERNQQTREALSELALEFLFAYIIIARLSGLFLHPGEFLHVNVWTLLAQAPSQGWVYGLVGAVLIVLWRMHIHKKRDWSVLMAATNASLFGIAIWWLIRVFIDQGPFLVRTIGMLLITVVLLLFSLRKPSTWTLPHRIWTLMAAALLLTSIGLPKIVQLGLFTPVQWFAVLILFAGLAAEAALDIQKQKDPPRHSVPNRNE